MARWKDGLRVATTIFEAAAWHHAVKPVCRCRHTGTFNRHGLWWHFHKRGWSDDLTAARAHFWCRNCRSLLGQRVRPSVLELVDESEGDVQLPFPSEAEWKRAVSRFRR